MKPAAGALWLVALLAVAVPYTVLAFGMEWRTEAGRIGPGFFPRLIGGALVAALVVALVRSLRSADDTEGREGIRGNTRMLLLMLAATALFVLFLEPLGALITGVLYVTAILTLLNPKRWPVNVAVGVALPAVLYLLFQILLDAGLPPGVLIPS